MKQILAMLLIISLLCCLLSCQNAAESEWILKLPEPNPVLEMQPEPVSYPMEETETISIMLPGSEELAISVLDLAKDYIGIPTEYRLQSFQNYNQALKLSLASEDMADMFYGYIGLSIYDFLDFGDEIAMDLTEVIGRSAPNYLDLLNQSVSLKFTAFNGVYKDAELFTFLQVLTGEPAINYGPYIRGDWLEELGLAAPHTYDEYHNVLIAFKDKYGCEQSLAMQPTSAVPGDYLAKGYGIPAYTSGNDMSTIGFYIDDDQVKYGPGEPAFWEYLTMLHQWYEEGLFTSDYVTWNDKTTYQKLAIQNDTGLIYMNTADAVGLSKNISGGGTLIPIQDAVLSEGATNHLSGAAKTSTGSKTLTVFANSPHADLCVRWCDFWYSEQGSHLLNYGTMDEIAPEEIEISMRYMQLPGIRDQSIDVKLMSDEAREAHEIWSLNSDTLGRIPADLQMSEADQQRFAILAQGLTTSVSIWASKVIVGEESLENREAFLKELNEYGLQKCLDCLNTYVFQ